MKTMNYKDLDWYVIFEDSKGKLLFLRDCLTNEQIQKYFVDKNMIDSLFDVKFNYDKTSPWWNRSYIREILNGPFLRELLDLRDLNLMKTTVILDEYEEKRTTEDYVRLITKEEAEALPLDVLKTLREYGYFTMSPHDIRTNGTARVFGVTGSRTPCYIRGFNVDDMSGVRPVISLKSNAPFCIIDKEKEVIEEIIKMIYILNNNVISKSKWLKYYQKYNSLRHFTGSVDFIVLKDLFAKALIGPNLSSLNEVNNYNEYVKSILEDLEQSSRLTLK